MTGKAKAHDRPHRAKARLPLLLAAAGLVLATPAAAWFLLRPSEAEPGEQLRAALAKLDRENDPAAWDSARRTAEQMREAGFRDPEFPGAVEFILGVTAGRGADSGGELERQHASAVSLLRAAERQGLDESRRPEWSLILGSSLFETGQLDAARPLLEDTWWSDDESWPVRAGKIHAGLALAEIELVRPLEAAAVPIGQIVAELGKRADLSSRDRRRLAIIRVRSALSAGRHDEAAAALGEIEASDTKDYTVALLRSEILLEEGNLDEAKKRLSELTRSGAGDGDPGRTAAAAYLLGRCEQRRGDAPAAERAYERASELAPETADGIRGALAAAQLLQQVGRDEEASALFRRAITSQSSVSPAPLPAEEVRGAVRSGWDAWAAQGAFERAVSLAIAAEPVLGKVESVRLQAKGRERAAAALGETRQANGGSAHGADAEVRDAAWRECGAAYRELAAVVTESVAIGEALWTAAESFSRGRAFEEAELALTDLMELKLSRLDAAVLSRRGSVRLDLGRPESAAEDFAAVLDRFPTDPEAFEARLLLGRCRLEQGDAEGAETAWRELLSLDELTPDAAEWRRALFALSELLHRRGVAALARADRDRAERTKDAAGDHAATAALDEAIARFGEYVRRSRGAERLAEARVLRADAMRRRAEIASARAAVAETESLREVHARESERLLAGAVAELRAVQGELAPFEDAGTLPPLEREFLKTTCFDLGHAFAALGRHQEALVAYGAAVNRYPDDARVLTAYLRMAESYRRLERPDDARAAVEQARLVLGQLPPSALGAGSALDQAGWEAWLARARDVGAGPAASDP